MTRFGAFRIRKIDALSPCLISTPHIASKNAGSTSTSSTSLTDTPSFKSLSSRQSVSPSTRSIVGAPSRVDSLRASAVNVPVVTIRPLSARLIIAPRKSRTTPEPTLSFQRFACNITWKDTRLTRNTPYPSMPPSPERPVTSTFTNPLSRHTRWHRRSKASGFIALSVERSCSVQSSASSGSSSGALE